MRPLIINPFDDQPVDHQHPTCDTALRPWGTAGSLPAAAESENTARPSHEPAAPHPPRVNPGVTRLFDRHDAWTAACAPVVRARPPKDGWRDTSGMQHAGAARAAGSGRTPPKSFGWRLASARAA